MAICSPWADTDVPRTERSRSMPHVGSSRRPPLSLEPNAPPPSKKPSTRPRLPISQPSDCTGKKLPKTWTKTKSFSTSTKACSTRVLIAGRTSLGRESRGSLTGFILGLNGTSIIRRITSEWWWRVGVASTSDWLTLSSAVISSDNPPPKVVQGYKFNIFYPDLM